MGTLPTHDVLAVIGEKAGGGKQYTNIGAAWLYTTDTGETTISISLNSLPMGRRIKIFPKREPLEQGFQQPQQPSQHYQQAPQLQPQQPQPAYSAPGVQQPQQPQPTYNQYSRSKG